MRYLSHPLLGSRYRESVRLLLKVDPEKSAEAIFGSTDALKLKSSLTLFRHAATSIGSDEDVRLFSTALRRFYGDKICEYTESSIQQPCVVQ